MTALTEAEILEDLENYLEILLPRVKANDPLSLHFQAHAPMARALAGLYTKCEAILDKVDPLRATGTDLDAIVASRLLTRGLGDFATGSLTFSINSPSLTAITIPIGTRCKAGDSYFATTATGTLVAGTLDISVAATAEIRGTDGNVASYTITTIYSSLPGIDAVTNPLAFAGGTASETDAELRQRYIDVTTLPGLATVEMIERHLEDLDDVSEAKVVSRDGGDLEVIVDDSNGIATIDTDVTDELEALVAAGCQARGCLAAQALASGGTVIVGEQVNESPNGALSTFTVDHAFVADSERLYLNGVVQLRGVDYTPTPSTGTFAILWTPLPDIALGDVLTVDYTSSTIAPVIDPISLTSADCAGGTVWVRPVGFISATDTFSISYVTTGGVTHVGTATVPIGTHRGELVAVTMASTADRAVSIPAQNFSGANDYDICIGLGVPNYLYNLPEEVTFTVTLNLIDTATPETDLANNIKDSITAWLSEYSIGENVEWSDLRNVVVLEYTAATDFSLRHSYTGSERPFIGIDRITSMSISGNGVSLTKDGDIASLEADQIAKCGTITVNVT